MTVNLKVYRIEVDEEEGDRYYREKGQKEPGHGVETHPSKWEGEGACLLLECEVAGRGQTEEVGREQTTVPSALSLRF